MGVDGLGKAMGEAMIALAVMCFVAGGIVAAAIYWLVKLGIYVVHHLHWA